MTKMATMFDGTAAILAFAELQHGPRTTPETKMLRWYDHNAGPENIQAYLAHSNHDLRTAHGLARPGQVYVDHEFISDQEMDKHRFYQEFLKPFDMRYTVGVTARTATDHGIVSNVIRSPRQGPAEEHHIALMGLLHTHVTQAVKIGDRLQRLSLENAALRNAFDYLSDGILIISGDGKVITANRAADELIKSRDGLMTVSGTLTASHGPTADALRELIAKTARNKLGQSPQTAALPIPKPSGGRSLHLLAMPVVTSMEAHFGFLDDTPSVFLMVTDPDLQPAPPEDRLRVIFGLTGAEARLSAALVTGLSIADYVEETGLTENTVRWTLKQIQAKTDCRRQANLVRLLATTATVIQK
ncbi:MAG: hypothetical protein AAGA73_01095 [Pseudomonadota bacterium]